MNFFGGGGGGGVSRGGSRGWVQGNEAFFIFSFKFV